MTSHATELNASAGSRYWSGMADWFETHNPFAYRHAYQLAVADLPDRMTRLYAGNLYGLVAAPSAVLNSCLFHTLLKERSRPVVFISSMPSEDVFNILESYGVELQAEQRDSSNRQLFLFQFGKDFRTQFSAWGLENFLKELETYQLPAHSLIVIQHAEFLFNEEDRLLLKRQAEMFQEWFAHHGHCGILVFPPESWQDSKQFNGNGRHHFPLRILKPRLAGLARLIDQKGNFIWRYEFWQTRKNLMGSQTYDLQFDPAGHVHAIQPFLPNEDNTLAPDERRIVVSRDAVKGEKAIPAHWEVDHDNDAVLNACRHAIAATVILSFDGNHALEELARIVHQFRQTCGNTLKIVVRCQREAMRHQHDRLMLDLGVNLVIGKGVPLSGMISMIESLQGQLFSKPLIEDFRNAVATVSAPSLYGYLPVPDFIKAVQATVLQSQSFNVPNILLKLQIRPHISHFEALEACSNLKRLGDLCTVDESWLYVFLFECRDQDIDIVKKRIFIVPSGQFFEGEFRFVDNEEILEQLHLFEMEIAGKPTTDYRSALRHGGNMLTASAIPAAKQPPQKNETARLETQEFVEPVIKAWKMPLRK